VATGATKPYEGITSNSISRIIGVGLVVVVIVSVVETGVVEGVEEERVGAMIGFILTKVITPATIYFRTPCPLLLTP
jgi:SNF family Na+-dependent transporter